MRARLIILAVIVAVAALGYFSGLHESLAPDRLREFAAGAGAWGPVVLLVLFIVLEPFGAPGFLFLVASATLWPFWLAFAVNWLGATGAGMLGFVFARYMGRDWIAERMPARLREWDTRLSERGLPVVIGFRILFFLNPASHWALGLSKVPVRTAILGTVIGFAPWVAIWSYFGADILDWFEAQSIGTWIAIAIAIAVFIVFRRARTQTTATDPG